MTLDEIWNKFSKRMSEVELIQRATKTSAQEELKVLQKYQEQISGNHKLKDASTSMHNMIFRDVRTGEPYSYGHMKQSVEDRQLSVLLRKNRQYQWLLAEAYEEFEDFLCLLYAYCGYSDPNFWSLADYGQIKFGEIASKDFNWHFERAKKKKGAPRSILQAFRESFASLQGVEEKNQLQVNLAFAIATIEKLRHIIVHNAGEAGSRKDFLEKLAQDAGVLNNGKINQENTDFVYQFFGHNEYENMVILLEVNVRQDLPFGVHVCRFGILSGILLSYAFLLTEMVRTHVSTVLDPKTETLGKGNDST